MKQLVEDIFKALNNLEEAVEKEYTDQRDDPNLILQLQALRHTRTTLNKAFPYSEIVPEVVMHEDKMEDVVPKKEPKDVPKGVRSSKD